MSVDDWDDDPRVGDLVARLHELPSEAWSPVDAAAPAPAAAPARRRASRGRILLAACASAALVAVGVAIGALVWSGGSDAPASGATRAVALGPLPGTSSRAGGVAHVGDTRLTLVVHGLPITRAGRYYEAWLMTDTRRLVPLASFRVDARGAARVTVTLPTSPSRYRFFDVSRQDAAAGPGISTRSVLRGPTG